MTWFVYILECADNTLYTGITTDCGRREKQHNSGKGAKYTRARMPVRIVYEEASLDRSTATKREMAIKKLSKAQKLALIESS